MLILRQGRLFTFPGLLFPDTTTRTDFAGKRKLDPMDDSMAYCTYLTNTRVLHYQRQHLSPENDFWVTGRSLTST